MKPYLTSATILAFAIAGAMPYLPAFADNNPVSQQVPSNQTQVNAKVTAEVQSRLVSAVGNAAAHDGWSALVGSFDKATRDRIGSEKDTNLSELNTRIDQFRKDFKDKYNEDFSLNATDLTSIPIYQGADDDHAIVQLSSFPFMSAKNDVTPRNDRIANDYSRNNGQVNLVLEHKLVGNGWRIVARDNISGQQLRDALGSKLAAIDNDKAAWPSNVHEAYTTITGQILQTLTQPDASNVTVENR